MMDPVVSSRFGKRPLLEIPPMSISGLGQVEVPSIQHSGPSHNHYRAGGIPPYSTGGLNHHSVQYSPRRADYSTTHTTTEFHYPDQPGHYSAGGLPPPAPQQPPHPSGGRPYNSAPNSFQNGRQYYYGPNGESLNHNQAPNPSFSDGTHPPPPLGMSGVPEPVTNQGYPGVVNPGSNLVYPGVANPVQPNHPYPGLVNPYAPHTAPQHRATAVPRIHYDQTNSPFTTGGPGFRVTCVLEYGRIVNIDVRETRGEFRGIPPFLKNELVRTYGKYPYTEVKLRNEGGEFHIYATHSNRRRVTQGRRRERRDNLDDDYFSTYGGGDDSYFDTEDSRDQQYGRYRDGEEDEFREEEPRYRGRGGGGGEGGGGGGRNGFYDDDYGDLR